MNPGLATATMQALFGPESRSLCRYSTCLRDATVEQLLEEVDRRLEVERDELDAMTRELASIQAELARLKEAGDA